MLSAGDVYCYYVRELGKYGACQILDVAEDGIYNIVLDSLTDLPLYEEDLKQIKPMEAKRPIREDRFERRYFLACVSFSAIPSQYIYIGRTAPVIAHFTISFSNYWPTGEEQINQIRWSEIPEKEIEEFNKFRFDRTLIRIGNKVFYKSRNNLDDELLDEISDYSELDSLLCLYHVDISNYFDGLFSYLKTRHYITNLNLWNHHQETLDLRETLFTDIRLDISGLHTLYLSECTNRLDLHGIAEPDLKIFAKNNGFRIHLTYSVKRNMISNFGLHEIDDVALTDIYEIDMNQVVDQFSEIRKLNLVGKPGKIINLGALGKLKSLEELFINDLFGFVSEDLVPLLGLEKLSLFWMEGIPEEAGKYARKAFKGKVYSLLISKLRKPEWIVENANNPFRSWDGDECIPSGAFRKATAIFKQLKTDLTAAAGKDDVLIAVTKYVEAFNKLDKKFEGFIETTQAEDIYLALKERLESMKADGESVWMEEALAVFDEKRDW